MCGRAAPTDRCRGAAGRPALVFLLALCLGSAVACGRKGDPVAPEQRLPEPPSELRLTGEDGVLVVSWTAPRRDQTGTALEPVAGYRIWRGAWSPGSGGASDGDGACPSCPQELVMAAQLDAVALRAAARDPTRWVDAEAKLGWTYRYQVQALLADQRPGPLSAPADISWVALPAPRFTLSPQDHSALARFEPPAWPEGLEPLGYRIYGPDGRLLAEGEPASPGLTVPNLSNDHAAELSGRLVVRTRRGWVIEGPGSVARVTPVDRVPPLPPASLTAFAVPGGVELRWLPAGEEPYHRLYVLRGAGGEALSPLAELPGTELAYRDREARPGQRYAYTVVSSDATGNRSLQPRAVTAVPLDPAAPRSGEE